MLTVAMTTGFFVGVADGEAEAVAGGDVVAVAEGEAEAVAEAEAEAEADVLAETEDAPSSPSEHPEMPRERATSPAIRAPYERRALHLFLMPSAPLDIEDLGASRRDMPPPSSCSQPLLLPGVRVRRRGSTRAPGA
ncbi:hypothetical protein ACIBKZ_06335 [Streptomyces sp. NPDC050421]|uniref:hypothetical protein n=1 Tax=Streptomyces sp. NPDC050421 TaxID=3365613 RepID=UPI0037962074